MNILLNSNNIKGVSIGGVNKEKASVANIASKPSLNNKFKGFFFLTKELIRLYSFN
jgi:hypothetical protein